MQLNFKMIEPFRDFATDITIEDKYYDLHNDFKCISIIYDVSLSKLTIDFKHRVGDILIHFIFENAELMKYIFKPNVEELIVDQIYLGKCMNEQYESMHKNIEKGYFYLSYIPDLDIELIAESITIVTE